MNAFQSGQVMKEKTGELTQTRRDKEHTQQKKVMWDKKKWKISYKWGENLGKRQNWLGHYRKQSIQILAIQE